MILFLGDSITDWWDHEIFQRDFGKYSPLNLGVAGYTTKDLMKLIEIDERLRNCHPKVIVLLIGTNNIIINDSVEEIANDIKIILETLLIKFPSCLIILRGLLPRGKFKNEYSRVHNRNINALINKYANDKTIFYIDNSVEFIDSVGNILNDLMPDNLHLSKKGYEVLTRVLTPFIIMIYQSTITSDYTNISS